MPIVRVKNKVLYFAHVPRCAGSAIENYLRKRFGPIAFLDRRFLSVPQEERWSATSPQHITRDAMERLFPEGFFDASFAVVRDPADRLRSVFLRQRDIEQILPADTDFNTWLSTLPLSGFDLDNHTRPMLDFIPKGCQIFRLEDGLDNVVKWLDDLVGDTDGPRHIERANSHEQKLQQADRASGPIPLLSPDLHATITDKFEADAFWCSYMPKPVERTVILHYHLFKNAGTSVDQILKQNFGDRWVTREFPTQGFNNSELLADWIRSDPDAVAFSTHTGFGPIPKIKGVRVISVMMLRDPLARIRSAYRFERKQEADTYGANLAKTTDFEAYVRTRLESPDDRQCRNFHAHRLASIVPGQTPEIDRARSAMQIVSVLGDVAEFNAAMTKLAAAIADFYPDFKWTSVQANTSHADTTLEPENPDFSALLNASNKDDIDLFAEFQRHSAQA